MKKIDRRLKACQSLLARSGSNGVQPDADGRQMTLAAEMQRKVGHAAPRLLPNKH